MHIKFFKIRKIKYKREVTVGLFLLLMVLFTRAMLLGNISQVIGLLAGIGSFFLYRKINLKKRESAILTSCYAFFIYCFLNGIFNASEDRLKLIIQIFIFWLAECYIAAVIMDDFCIEQIFGKILTYILIICTLSYMISFVLGLIVGWENIKIGMFDYKYEYISPVYFPITPTYGEITFSSMKIPRMLSIGREVGISQTIYIWAFFKSEDYFEKYNLVKILLGIGIFCCLSTTGLVLFVSLLVFNSIIDKKKFSNKTNVKKMLYMIVGILVTIAAIYLLLNGGNLSLSKRIDISYIDRTQAFNYGFREFAKNPLFGTGFMKDLSSSTSIQVGIALISSIGSIGIVGILLFANIYIQAFFKAKNKRKFILCNTSFLVTTLFAQPLYTSALIYIFLFADYSKNGKCEDKKYSKYKEDNKK